MRPIFVAATEEFLKAYMKYMLYETVVTPCWYGDLDANGRAPPQEFAVNIEHYHFTLKETGR